MRRRAFLASLGGAAIWPLAARAVERGSLPRIGYLGPGAGPDPRYGEFLAGLRDLGYVEGKSIEIEFRFAGGDPERLAEAAAEFVHENVNIIVTAGIGVYTAQRATTTVPIVMAAGADVVAMGLAASLSHPGGNITGSTFFVLEVMAKRLELLKQVAPSMSRSGLLLLRGNPFDSYLLNALEVSAKAAMVEVQPIEIASPSDFESALSAVAGGSIGGLIADDPPPLNTPSIIALAQRRGLPSIGAPAFAANGWLLGFGVRFEPMFRRAATFVDKILKGAKPGDIPIEQATKFTTVVNLKTAKALGIEIPAMLLAQADEVIE